MQPCPAKTIKNKVFDVEDAHHGSHGGPGVSFEGPLGSKGVFIHRRNADRPSHSAQRQQAELQQWRIIILRNIYRHVQAQATNYIIGSLCLTVAISAQVRLSH